MWNFAKTAALMSNDKNPLVAESHGSHGNWDRTTNKRHLVDNDGGYHAWSAPQGGGEAQLETDAHDALLANDAKRFKTADEKQLLWKARLATAEGQQTLLLAELSMVEYHLQELQEVVRAAVLRVEEKKAALNECRTHMARMSEAVGILSALGRD